MKKKRFLYRYIAIVTIIALAYIQSIQLAHKTHPSHSGTEQITENSPFGDTREISCFICYHLQHHHSDHFLLPIASPSLQYEPVQSRLYAHPEATNLLSFISIRNNKSPPSLISIS